MEIIYETIKNLYEKYFIKIKCFNLLTFDFHLIFNIIKACQNKKALIKGENISHMCSYYRVFGGFCYISKLIIASEKTKNISGSYILF